MLKELKGTGVALVTPFNTDKSIDFNGLKALLKHTAKEGVDYYVVQGTTGESATIEHEEKIELLDYVRKNNDAGLPIVFGLGGNNTNAVLKEIEETDLSGVSAILSVCPYYSKPSQSGMIHHFEAIADQSPVPVILYNVPSRTGANLTASSTVKLAQHENIVAIKEASGDMTQLQHLVRDLPKDFMLLSGDDMLCPTIYAMGGVGVISVMANAFGGVFKKVRTRCEKGDTWGAHQEMNRLLEINPLMYKEANPVGIKQVLKEMGICEPYVRMPLLEASEALKTEIKAAMGKI